MARLIFPDEGSRLAYDPGTGRLLAAGTKVFLYLDAAATQPATDLLNADLSANTTGFVTLDAYRRLPIFSGPTSGADTLYAVISGGPVTPVYARTDDRLDGLAARVTTLETGGTGTAVQSVNGHTGTAVTVTKADVGLGNADNTADTAKPVSTAQQTALNAKADLVAGVVPTAQLPALAITDTFPVASQAAMLALTAQRGDVAIRSDLGKSFVLAADDPTVLANWLELPAAGKVTSVNGQQGVVVLAASDVGADASGAASAAQAAAIAAAATDATTKANAAQAASAQKLVRTAVKTANYTAAAGDLVPCDTTSAAFTVTLPTAPAAGSRVAVKIVTLGSGHFVTIACGGSDVFNKTAGATTATLQLLGHAMNLQYDTGGIWTVVADDVPKSQLDATYVSAVNVVGHGATGDGVTDDTAAIQAAIAALPATGGVVYFPPGSYVTSGLTITSFVQLVGAGSKSSRLLASANSVALITVNGTAGTPATYTRIAHLGLMANSKTGVVGIHGAYWNLGTCENIWASQLDWIITTDNASYTNISRIRTDELVNGVYLYKAVNTVVADSTLSGVSGTALLGVQVDSGCDGAELHNVNVNAAATGVSITHTDVGTHYPYSTICTAVQAGGGTGDGWQIYAGSGIQLTACVAVTMGGFGFRVRTTKGVLFSNCRSVNNGKNGVLIDAGSGADGHFTWLGGEVVANGTANAATWEGFAVGSNCVNWAVLGAKLGQYGDYGNTQTYGLTIGAGCSDFTVNGIAWGANLSGNYANLATGTNRIATASYSAGNITISSTSYVTVGFADLTLQAKAGDVVEIGTGFRVDAGAGVLFLDAATIVSAAIVTYLSGNGAGGNGAPTWLRLGSAAAYPSGTLVATLGSGDVSGGKVTLRLVAKVDASNRAIVNSGSEAIQFWARNHGQPLTAA